jgi:hypothetical protein
VRVGVGFGFAVRVGVGRGVRVGVGINVLVGIGVAVAVGVAVGVGASTEKVVSPQSYGVASKYLPAARAGNCTVAAASPRSSMGPRRNSPIVCPLLVAYTAHTYRPDVKAARWSDVLPSETMGPSTVMKEVDGCSRM